MKTLAAYAEPRTGPFHRLLVRCVTFAGVSAVGCWYVLSHVLLRFWWSPLSLQGGAPAVYPVYSEISVRHP